MGGIDVTEDKAYGSNSAIRDRLTSSVPNLWNRWYGLVHEVGQKRLVVHVHDYGYFLLKELEKYHPKVFNASQCGVDFHELGLLSAVCTSRGTGAMPVDQVEGIEFL